MFHLPPNKSQNCWPSYLKIQFSIFSIHFWIKCRKWNLLRIQFYSRDDNLASMRNFLWLTQWSTGKIQPNANYFPAPFNFNFNVSPLFGLLYSRYEASGWDNTIKTEDVTQLFLQLLHIASRQLSLYQTVFYHIGSGDWGWGMDEPWMINVLNY